MRNLPRVMRWGLRQSMRAMQVGETLMSMMAMSDVGPLWLQRVAVHQDYAWFVSLVLWGLVLLTWWRHPQRERDWGWLAAPGSMAIFTVAVQFMIFDPTFDWFQDRLVPGTTNVYEPAVIEVELLGDILLTVGWSTVAGWWWWRALAMQSARLGWRMMGMFLGAGAGAFTLGFPAWGTWVLCFAVFASGMRIGSTWTGRTSRIGVGLIVLMMMCSTIGPGAMMTGSMQREASATPWGLLAAVMQIVVAATLLIVVGREALGGESVDEAERQHRRQEWRTFAILGTLWVGVGLAYAQRVGADNRDELQRNRLRSVAAEAMVFDPTHLQPLVGDALQLEHVAAPPRGAETPRLRARILAGAEAHALRMELARLVIETPFLDRARVLVIRDGWLIELASSRLPREWDDVEVLRKATVADQMAMRSAVPYIVHSAVPELNAEYYCRAPIVARDGRILGWLDYVRREFFQSLERKWRVGPLSVVALGLLGGFMVVLHRRSLREQERSWWRAAAEREASRLKTLFLARVSHELRTPLQSLLGYSELLERDAQDDVQRERAGRLREHGDLLLRLVNDLLDLSAIEAGRLELHVHPVEMDQLVRGVVESLRPQADAKNLALVCTVEEKLRGQWFEADAARVRQIVFNLLGNAVKFTLRGGVRVSLASTKEGGLRIDVYDTGPGVRQDQQANLFAPFSRLETTADVEGSGLGLAMVAALARLMGGSVGVESDGINGARFWIEWQAASVSAPAFERVGGTAILERDRLRLRGQRVLVAEDNVLVRVLFQSVLVELGAECDVVGDGETALQAALAGHYTAMILDVALPGIEGLEVARRLRTRGVSPGPLRIVGVSAYANEDITRRALASGMDVFLTKPVSLSDLAAALVGSERTGGPSHGSVNLAPVRELFRDGAATEAAGVRRAVEAGDAAQLRKVAHYLANSAAAVGDDCLMTAALGLQSAAEAGNRDQWPERLNAVELAFVPWLVVKSDRESGG